MYRKIAFITAMSVAATYSSVAFADAMLVYDPANFVKNALTAEQSIQTAANTLNTFQETVKSYEQLASQYALTVTNLRELANINQYIADLKNTVNSYYGSSPLSQLASLDPDSGNYAAERDAILKQYYQKPVDPNYIQAEFQGALNQAQIDAMKAEAQQQNLNYQALQDTVDEAAHEQAAATQRGQDIQKYGTAINGLGENSELKTQQTTALEINFQLQQNEQVIQQLNEQLKYARLQQAEEMSEKAKESQAEQASLERAINQGTSGLGRDRWGDF